MKVPYNIGNYLPFFTKLNWQHRFQAYSGKRTLKIKDWSLIWPKNGLPPFQILHDKTGITDVIWKLVSVDDGSELTLDDSLLKVTCYSQSVEGYTWNDNPICEIDPECGLYYMTLQLDDDTYYSEVFKLEEIPDNSEITMRVTNCVGGLPESGNQWTIVADLCLAFTAESITIGVEELDLSQSGNSITFTDDEQGYYTIYLTALSQWGTITQKYALQYDIIDPCNTYTLTKI